MIVDHRRRWIPDLIPNVPNVPNALMDHRREHCDGTGPGTVDHQPSESLVIAPATQRWFFPRLGLPGKVVQLFTCFAFVLASMLTNGHDVHNHSVSR